MGSLHHLIRDSSMRSTCVVLGLHGVRLSLQIHNLWGNRLHWLVAAWSPTVDRLVASVGKCTRLCRHLEREVVSDCEY